MNPTKNIKSTIVWFSAFSRKLGKAISMALYAFEPSGSPYLYQLPYFSSFVKVLYAATIYWNFFLEATSSVPTLSG